VELGPLVDTLLAGDDELPLRFSILISVPSAFLITTLCRGAKAVELAFSREVVVEGVGGGDEMLLILEEGWDIGGGGCGAWTGDAVAWDRVGVPGPPWRGMRGFRGDIGIPA
jgi:hypothetical protein